MLGESKTVRKCHLERRQTEMSAGEQLAEEEERSDRKMKATEDKRAGGKDGRRREIKSNSCRKENNWLGNIRDGEEK